MKRRHRLCVALLLFPTLMFAQTAASPSGKGAAASAVSGVSSPVMSAAARSRARQVFTYFESGQAAPLYAAFSPEMKKAQTLAKVTSTEKGLSSQLGREEKMLGENFAPDLTSKVTVYSRLSQFSRSKEPIFVLIAIDEQSQVATIQFRPAPPVPANRFDDYKDSTRLKLPFSGEWFVLQGGNEVFQNANVYREPERFSMVFTVLKDGQAFSGDGTKNEQFYCFGQPVAAPADGTVVMVNDSFLDNLPGRSEQVMPNGNRVLIYHGHNEYSLLLHLKQGSIKVKARDKVKQGDVVGECGNSGSSAAPHLEYRLQNTNGRPYPATLPTQFVGYVADGKPVESGLPLRGQYVSNSPEATSPTAEKK